MCVQPETNIPAGRPPWTAVPAPHMLGLPLLDAAQWVKASLNGWLVRLCQPPGPKAQVTKPGGSNKPVH